MTRLSQIALAAKPITSDASRATEATAGASKTSSASAAPAPKGAHAKALLAAAQAFSERRKASGLAA
jgi:hypothetical protein